MCVGDQNDIDNHREAFYNMLALAAHSVRSPLERLWIALDTLRSKDKGRGGQFVREIQDAFEKLELVNVRIETMLLSRKGLIEVTGLNLSRVCLAEVIAVCVSRHQNLATQGNRRINLRYFGRLPKIHGDAGKLGLVFDNLIENAIKYSYRGSEVVISVEAVGSDVRVSVADRGLGIPQNMQERIFEGFVQSDDRRHHIQGTGLGLYVSKMIVKAHGGTIQVESKPFFDDPERRAAYEGYETVFVVRLPAEEKT